MKKQEEWKQIVFASESYKKLYFGILWRRDIVFSYFFCSTYYENWGKWRILYRFHAVLYTHCVISHRRYRLDEYILWHVAEQIPIIKFPVCIVQKSLLYQRIMWDWLNSLLLVSLYPKYFGKRDFNAFYNLSLHSFHFQVLIS